MNNFSRAVFLTVALVYISASPLLAQSGIWASAYYAGWQQGYNNTGYLPAQNVDYSAVTHIIHFALVPRADGSLDDAANSVTAYNANQLITRAHAAGKKVIISVGGWNSDVGFRGATSAANRSLFISNLISLMTTRSYDGIDIDWEPFQSSDGPQYVAFIAALRTALNAITPRPLLTAATGASMRDVLAQVHQHFDQINLMTYDYSGPWPGWVTWHNAPIYDGGYRFPSTNGPVPSANRDIDLTIAAGVPANKLGIGIDFYGYVWSGGSGTPAGGVTEPRQSWTTTPSVQGNVPYYTIMQNYYQQQYYRWDSAPQAAYLSIDNSGSTGDKFISYDNQTTVQKKVEYVRSKNIGGVIIWELGGGYRANLPGGQRDSLLQAVKTAVFGGAPPAPPSAPALVSPTNGAVNVSIAPSLNWNSTNGATTYGVQVSMSSTFSSTVINQNGLTGTSLTVSGLSYNTLYYWRVNASNSNGTSDWSSVWNFTTGTNVVPPPQDSLYRVIAEDQFNRANQRPLSGRRWSTLLNQPGNGTIELLGNAIQPYNANGSGNAGGIVWDSLVSKGTGVRLTIAQKSNNNTNSSLFIYLRMNSKDLSTGNGYRLQYMDIPNGNDILAIQRVTNGVNATNLSSVFREINVGDTLKFVVANDANNTMILYINGTQALSAVDNQFSSPLWYIWVRGFVLPTIPRYDNFAVLSSIQQLPGPVADTVAPAVTITSPANNASVSGTIGISANATDNIRVVGVQFKIDGINLGDEIENPPYTLSWNTIQVANGQHTITAVARDSSGNQGISTITVTVSNATPLPSSQYVYDEDLLTPWINASWNAAVQFNATEQHFTGTRAIKVTQGAWGALRLHSGPWGNPVDINTSGFDKFEFVIHGGVNGISLGVFFENDLNQSFPAVRYIWVPANQWKIISLPISQLNPNGHIVHRIVIQDLSGRQKTYYVDDVRFSTSSMASGEPSNPNDVFMSNTSPATFELTGNFPNPFNPATVIKYAIPQDARVSLEVYNTLGQRVMTLLDNEVHSAGFYEIAFNAINLPSGVYFYRLTADPLSGEKPFADTKKMLFRK